MQLERLCLTLGAVALIVGSAQAQQFVMVAQTDNDRVMLFDAFDGSIVSLEYISDSSGTPYNLAVPIEATQVGNEIWVFDQFTDQIVRFGPAGSHVATILPAVGMVDAMHGAAFADNTIYVANDGAGHGATPETVVTFDSSGTRLGQFDVSNSGKRPSDVVEFNGELLVPHFTAAPKIGRYDYAGNLLGIFHSSDGITGIDHIGQVSPTASNTVLAAGLAAPIGIYEYDASGTQINYWAVGTGNSGVFELGNGTIMFTDGGGVHVLDRGTGAVTDILKGVSSQHISRLGWLPFGRFCTSRPSSLPNCTPTLDGPGFYLSKAAGSGSYDITAAPVPGGAGAPGILIYTRNGLLAPPANTVFGDLCLNQFLRATFPVVPGGTTGVCDGSYRWDFGNIAAVTSLIVVGDSLRAQAWYRDPANPGTANFTEGIGLIHVTP